MGAFPQHLQREPQIRNKAVLQILHQGAFWGAGAPRPFLAMMLSGEVRLPSAISAPSAIIQALLYDPARLGKSLRIDGRGLASLPPFLPR